MSTDSLPCPGPRRRTVLVGGVAGAASLLGCTAEAEKDPRRVEHAPAAERLRAREARESALLLRVYDATARTHPELADRLAPLRAEVALHAEALGLPSAKGASASPAAGAPTSSPSTASVPGDPQKALAVLASAERRTADARTTALAEAPPELARLLASVAAAGATHAYLLSSER